METQTFWKGIWSQRKEHYKNSEWMKQDDGQKKIDITKYKVITVLRKMPNWKVPGPDNVQGYLVIG